VTIYFYSRKGERKMNLVLAFDGSNSAKSAFVLTQKFAKASKAKVYIVTSLIGGKASDADAIDEANTRLEYAQKTMAQAGIICEKHLLVRGLEPGEDIVNFASDINADFIVVGIVKTSRVQKGLFGSTAQHVILEAKCPVITVKE
jgi:nucleotide-binding universal stress UspA family protein